MVGRREGVPGGRHHRHVVRVTPEEEARLLVRAGGDPRAIAGLLAGAALSGGGETPAERRVAMVELFGIHRELSVLAGRDRVVREELRPVVERVCAAIDGLAAQGVRG